MFWCFIFYYFFWKILYREIEWCRVFLVLFIIYYLIVENFGLYLLIINVIKYFECKWIFLLREKYGVFSYCKVRF